MPNGQLPVAVRAVARFWVLGLPNETAEDHAESLVGGVGHGLVMP
jgi:hypothetical protein